MENPAEIQHVLIAKLQADLFDRKKGGAQKLTCQVHFQPGVVSLHGHSRGFFKAGRHMLIA